MKLRLREVIINNKIMYKVERRVMFLFWSDSYKGKRLCSLSYTVDQGLSALDNATALVNKLNRPLKTIAVR